MKKFRILETVVLTRDLPERDLCAGDLGAVMEVYPEDLYDVEFVTASGRTKALVSLASRDLRPIAGTDLIAVRSLKKSA